MYFLLENYTMYGHDIFGRLCEIIIYTAYTLSTSHCMQTLLDSSHLFSTACITLTMYAFSIRATRAMFEKQ